MWFGLGVLVGGLVTARLLARRRDRQRRSDCAALHRAQARLRALQTATLNELTDVAQLMPRRLPPVGKNIAAARTDSDFGREGDHRLHWRRVRMPGSCISGLLADVGALDDQPRAEEVWPPC